MFFFGQYARLAAWLGHCYKAESPTSPGRCVAHDFDIRDGTEFVEMTAKILFRDFTVKASNEMFPEEEKNNDNRGDPVLV